MKIAVTSHAVDRYRERVEGAKGFNDESLREIIRDIVRKGFDMGMVRPHTTEKSRRIIPFQSGDSVLYLSIGNNTTNYPADLAVIGVLYEKEVTPGKVTMGVTLGDVLPELKNAKRRIEVGEEGNNRGTTPRFLLFIGPVDKTIDQYRAANVQELRRILHTRKPKPEEVSIYQLIE